jgi:hypothetical protein
MQAWGTVLALPLSLGALIFTGLLLRHEMRARREERLQATAAQARLVRAARDFTFAAGDDGTIEAQRKVFNHSDKPVFDVRFEMFFENGRAEHLDPAREDVIEPEGERTFIIRMTTDDTSDADIDDFVPVSAALAFMDAQGKEWHRLDNDSGPQPYQGWIFRDLRLMKLLVDYLEIRVWLSRATDPASIAFTQFKLKLWRKIWKRDAKYSVLPLIPGELHYFPPGVETRSPTETQSSPPANES